MTKRLSKKKIVNIKAKVFPEATVTVFTGIKRYDGPAPWDSNKETMPNNSVTIVRMNKRLKSITFK